MATARAAPVGWSAIWWPVRGVKARVAAPGEDGFDRADRRHGESPARRRDETRRSRPRRPHPVPVRRTRRRPRRPCRTRPYRHGPQPEAPGAPIEAADVLLIGDTPADVAVTGSAGVPVLGVATGRSTLRTLAEAGASHVIRRAIGVGQVGDRALSYECSLSGRRTAGRAEPSVRACRSTSGTSPSRGSWALQQQWATSGITPVRRLPGEPGVRARVDADVHQPGAR